MLKYDQYMATKQSSSTLHRLRKTKAALLAVSLTFAGVLMMLANSWVSSHNLEAFEWIKSLPLGELGGTLFGAGFLSTLFEAVFRKDQDEANAERFRSIIREESPAIRDAVIGGFAIHSKDLERVATPELLDEIAANVMSLRLGDAEFAREIYADIRDQAIRATERWRDVEVRVRLSKYLESSTYGTTLFNVTVEWEYTTILSGGSRRFACVADRSEFHALREDDPATSIWMIARRPGIDPGDRKVYELLEFTIDGETQQIRRTTRKSGQVYTVTPPARFRNGQPVRIRQVFRTVTPMWGHRLFFELPQPARNVRISVDYTDTEIAVMRVSDSVGTTRAPIISQSPEAVPGKIISIESDAWLLAKSGFAFTWTLKSELPEENSLLQATR